MDKVKEILNYLLHGDYFDYILDNFYVLVVAAGLFLAIGYFYIFHPAILLYLLIAGILFVGWFMMFLLLPDLHDKLQRAIRSVGRWVNNFFTHKF